MDGVRGRSLAAEIARQLAEEMGVDLTVEETDGIIVLSGVVDSLDAREAAERLATALAPGKTIENDLGLAPAALEEEVELQPDFTSVRLRVLGDVADDRAGGEHDESADGAEPFFPPTDPVVTLNPHGGVEVLGGFSATSMDSIEVESSAEDEAPGDEAIADAVRRELREDAATTDLVIRVSVRRGVVRLRGTAPSVEDTTNAEEVASRVPGVLEVRDELEVAGL